MINFIDITCEDRFPEMLKIKKSNHLSSGSTTFLSDSFPSLTPFKTSDSLLGEFIDELALLDPFPPGNKDDNFDPKADLREIEYLLNRDPSTDSPPKTDIDIVDPILERFIDEPAFVYSSPPRDDNDDDDDLFNFKSNNEESKKLLSHLRLLLCYHLPLEMKTFNPNILVNGSTHFVTNEVTQEKNLKEKTSSEALLILEDSNFLPLSSDHELLFFLELTVIETLLSFSSENKDTVFNPRIPILKGIYSFTLGLSHRTYETFNVVNVHLNILNDGLMMIFPFFYFCPKDKGIRGESS
nr:hypothetical protein [Tanacetum cinerariifolium]GEY65041.1 hypothetical protein [Tanacetum cinerariifolium]